MNILRNVKKSVIRRLRPPTMVQSRSTRPSSDNWGFDRGCPIDRHYIDRFYASHTGDMGGAMLEIQSLVYTGRHGQRATSRDVLDIDPGNENATVVADLSAADSVDSDRFDCFILSQTLHLIFEIRAAIFHAHRILKPGGVLLATAPALSRVDSGLFTSDYWRLTPASCERLFAERFGADNVTVSSFGNALSCSAFINGMAAEEFSASELDPVDSYFPMIMTIRARKAQA
jgi:SAM-dependent methyltransferase